MVRRISGRLSCLSAVALIVLSLAAAVPAFAQSTGMVKGVVLDDKGQPVEGAKITVEMVGGTGRRFETKTNKKGEYIQIGLASGQYKVTAEKDKLGSAPATVGVRANTTQEANLTLAMASASAVKEAQAKNAAIQKTFDEGVQAIVRELLDAGLLNGEVMTCTGETLAAQVARLGAKGADGTVIHPVSKPYKPTGGLRVLGGNLSPDFSAILKLAGVEGGLENNIFRGRARIFEGEQALLAALDRTPDRKSTRLNSSHRT